jgi:2-amino-4-hydroxy-6-hydroxymethyldihydropteridine diphosphokinase
LSKAWLGLGANIGDAKIQILQALKHLEQAPNIKIIKKSTIITSEAWGLTEQNDFHNMVIEIKTKLAPKKLLANILEIEKKMGRKRIKKWGPRNIDIDIIAYEKLEQKTKNLTLPHPHAFERNFVLNPLREIAPDIADWITERSK